MGVDPDPTPALYASLASWWPLVSPVEEYAPEAEYLRRLIARFVDGPRDTLLELGCGGGHLASHLASHFALTLTDIAPDMLEGSRRLNPGCEHLLGDMRTLRLRRSFDVVLVQDAIGYMTTELDLAAAIKTAFVHCRPGGAACFFPDYVSESFSPGTVHGGQELGSRALRYLEWTHAVDPQDNTYACDFAFLCREAGVTQALHEQHRFGLFSRDVWRKLLTDVGFVAHGVLTDWDKDVFVGQRPCSPDLRTP